MKTTNCIGAFVPILDLNDVSQQTWKSNSSAISSSCLNAAFCTPPNFGKKQPPDFMIFEPYKRPQASHPWLANANARRPIWFKLNLFCSFQLHFVSIMQLKVIFSTRCRFLQFLDRVNFQIYDLLVIKSCSTVAMHISRPQ